eukprot:jgi/Mesen1/11033/ME000098S10431
MKQADPAPRELPFASETRPSASEGKASGWWQFHVHRLKTAGYFKKQAELGGTHAEMTWCTRSVPMMAATLAAASASPFSKTIRLLERGGADLLPQPCLRLQRLQRLRGLQLLRQKLADAKEAVREIDWLSPRQVAGAAGIRRGVSVVVVCERLHQVVQVACTQRRSTTTSSSSSGGRVVRLCSASAAVSGELSSVTSRLATKDTAAGLSILRIRDGSARLIGAVAQPCGNCSSRPNIEDTKSRGLTRSRKAALAPAGSRRPSSLGYVQVPPAEGNQSFHFSYPLASIPEGQVRPSRVFEKLISGKRLWQGTFCKLAAYGGKKSKNKEKEEENKKKRTT